MIKIYYQTEGVKMIDGRAFTFLELCNVMNYHKTAQNLNMTQPAVTQHIKYLERLYGCKLFEYTNKKLYKTEPVKKYTGKFGISTLNRFENTRVITIIVNSGFNKLHKSPSIDLLYFNFISLETSSLNKGINFVKTLILRTI